MTNNRITELLSDIHTELTPDEVKEKICLIDDIMKAKRLLYGMGYEEHDEFKDDERLAAHFDYLYDLHFASLHLLMKHYEKQINSHVQRKIYQAS